MKPILFNTEMVQAILEGRKTCTRRKITRTPSNDEPCGYGFWREFNHNDGKWYIKDYTHSCCWLTQEEYMGKYAPYQIGDILYVRETFFEGDILDSNEDIVERDIVIYATDDLSEHGLEELKWKPSIHMPKKLARIFLKVTDIRVERLQDITTEQAKAEGIREYTKDGEVLKYALNENQYRWSSMPRNAIEPFIKLWDSTVNKKDIDKYGWKANPWVWVIEFKKISKEEALGNE